jgi:phage shock protein A
MAIEELSTSLHDQYERSGGDDGLLARVVVETPHLSNSVAELRRTQSKVSDELDHLRQSLTDLSRTVDVAAVRRKVADLTAQIRELRAWETDIVYEAYDFDLGTGD